MNRIKQKLKQGDSVLVCNPNFPSAALVEYVGELGFDAAFIDCEHGTSGFERAEDLARAARAAGMTSILRPWAMERGLITRFLDCGVGGIQFPGIETAEEAREAVDIVRRARGKQFDDTVVALMIESPAAIEKLGEIVAVDGVDSIVIGLADLAAQLGHPENRGHPDVLAAIDRIIAKVSTSKGPVAGFNLHHWEDGPSLQRKGVRWLTIHARTMLRRGTADLRRILGRKEP